MSVDKEAAMIAKTPAPITSASMVSDLRASGLSEGMLVLVHSSMSKIGWVCGGPVAVLLALQEVLGETGTLIMPAHSSDNSDPAHWKNPPVPEDWVDAIRMNMPAFDPHITPTRKMGRIAECFRSHKDVQRSDHPQDSFCALGPQAAWVTQDHSLHAGLGEGSPLHRLYLRDGWVFLLGVTHANNTSLHLAEYLATYPGKNWVQDGCAMITNGRREWVTFPSLDLNSDDFEQIGAAYANTYPQNIIYGKVGNADTLLFRQKPLVDFAIPWMQSNRKLND